MDADPMYLAMAGVDLSLGFLLNAVAPLLLFLPVFIATLLWAPRLTARRSAS